MSETQFFGELAADSRGQNDKRPPVVLLHGLSFDRRHWAPLLRELAVVDPGRRAVSFDLPGHGESPSRAAYRLDEVAAVVHEAVIAAGLDAPIMVGHSLGGVLATVYAARYPVRGVVNVDQPLLVGGFQDMLRGADALLRSPLYGRFWDHMLAGMGIEKLPAEMQAVVYAAGTPHQDLLLGYWEEVMSVPAEELTEQREHDFAVIRAKGAAYHYVCGKDLEAGYRRWLWRVMPGATITVLAGGHFLHLAAPGELAKILHSM